MKCTAIFSVTSTPLFAVYPTPPESYCQLTILPLINYVASKSSKPRKPPSANVLPHQLYFDRALMQLYAKKLLPPMH